MNLNNIYIIIGLVVVGVIVFTVYFQFVKPQMDDRMIPTTFTTTIRSAELPLEFSYPSGQDAYTMIEPPIATTSPDGLKKVYIIMDNQAYIDFQHAENPTDAPPTVTVLAFQDPELPEGMEDVGRITRLQNWAQQNTQYSSFNLVKTEPEIIEIDGVQFIHYLTDGLYQQDVHLANYRGHTYVFTGQYENEDDEIQQMYNEMITTIIFN